MATHPDSSSKTHDTSLFQKEMKIYDALPQKIRILIQQCPEMLVPSEIEEAINIAGKDKVIATLEAPVPHSGSYTRDLIFLVDPLYSFDIDRLI